MPEEKQVLHRISKIDEDAIRNLIERKLQPALRASASARKECELRQNEYTEYMLENSLLSQTKTRTSSKNRLCYEHLPRLVDITGVTYLDILKEISVNAEGDAIQPRWPLEVEGKMCAFCEIMTDAQRLSTLSLIRRIIAPVYANDEVGGDSSILRLYNATTLRTSCTAEMIRQAAQMGVHDVFGRRYVAYNYNALELNMVAYLAICFDVSPHWLMKLDERYPVLASSGEVETIMDLFCFLPNERKEMVVRAAETAVNAGGAI